MLTRDISDFGYKQFEDLKKLINARLNTGFPDSFIQYNVVITFDTDNDEIYFSNEVYQLCTYIDDNTLCMIEDLD